MRRESYRPGTEVGFCERLHAEGEWIAGLTAPQVLVEKRHPGKGAGIRLSGTLTGLIEGADHHRVDLTVVRFDARNRRFNEFFGTHLSLCDECCLIGGVEPLGVGHEMLLSIGG